MYHEDSKSKFQIFQCLREAFFHVHTRIDRKVALFSQRCWWAVVFSPNHMLDGCPLSGSQCFLVVVEAICLLAVHPALKNAK